MGAKISQLSEADFDKLIDECGAMNIILGLIHGKGGGLASLSGPFADKLINRLAKEGGR